MKILKGLCKIFQVDFWASFNCWKNCSIVDRVIKDEELLVRLIQKRHFKKVDTLNIKAGDILIDSNNAGVSLNRIRYSSEQDCKTQAIKMEAHDQGSKHFGYLLFKYNDFIVAHKKHLASRPNFEAEITASPLDEASNRYPPKIKILATFKGNLGHSDLTYINPAQTNEESPNIAKRIFSHLLFKKSTVVIDVKESSIYGYDDFEVLYGKEQNKYIYR
jgi:hypothetical protein